MRKFISTCLFVTIISSCGSSDVRVGNTRQSPTGKEIGSGVVLPKGEDKSTTDANGSGGAEVSAGLVSTPATDSTNTARVAQAILSIVSNKPDSTCCSVVVSTSSGTSTIPFTEKVDPTSQAQGQTTSSSESVMQTQVEETAEQVASWIDAPLDAQTIIMTIDPSKVENTQSLLEGQSTIISTQQVVDVGHVQITTVLQTISVVNVVDSDPIPSLSEPLSEPLTLPIQIELFTSTVVLNQVIIPISDDAEQAAQAAQASQTCSSNASAIGAAHANSNSCAASSTSTTLHYTKVQ